MLPQDDLEINKLTLNCKLNYKSTNEVTEVDFEFNLDLPFSFWEDIKSALYFVFKTIVWLFKKVFVFLRNNTDKK